MSSPPASSAAASAADPEISLFCQVQDIYSFFKDSVGTTKPQKGTSEDVARYNAVAALNSAAERGSAGCAHSWLDMSHAQHELLVDLLLKYYCISRANPEQNAPPFSAHNLDAHKRLDELLRLLVPLYNAPIVGREFWAFEQARGDIAQARRLVTRATNDENRSLPYARRVLRDAEARLEERRSRANAERVEHLQQVKAAFSLLYDNAALVPGFADAAQQSAIEVYMSRLDPSRQDAVVTRVRDFIFAACEERAVEGEALDPDEQLVDLLGALHARDLGHALCAARLNSVVYFFESHGAPSAVVEHFQGVVDQFCGDVWSRRFPQLALSQQLYAVGMVRALLGRIQGLTARQVADELAVILPMNASNPTSWKHPPKVDGPPAVLRSLAHRSSTHDAPIDADLTGMATSSRYLPQARSARW
ncbi:hypothetical protein JCM8208_005486 [Rhodotorula glutinis]